MVTRSTSWPRVTISRARKWHTEAAPPPRDVSLKWVYFDYDKATLTPQTIAVLDETVRTLKENPNINVELAGHTDGRGTDSYNLRLSQRRVENVKKYLTSKGISESRLKTVAFGKAKPVALNTTEGGRAQNRRVEIRIIK